MLKGKELGKAISQAISMKLARGEVKSKAEIAREFGVRPPSVADWEKKGSISKDKLPKLWKYFSDVVGPEHWGLQKSEWPTGLSKEVHGSINENKSIYEVKPTSTAATPLSQVERDLIAGFRAAPLETQARYYIEAKRDFSGRSEKQ